MIKTTIFKKKLKICEEVKEDNNLQKTKQQFSEVSIELTKLLNETDKKEGGIFFTPQNICERTFKIVEGIKDKKIIKILEPSCGSCEFIDVLQKNLNNKEVKIMGVEYNNQIYNKIKEIEKFKTVEIINSDFLKWETQNKYDLIIGNPPYFVVKKTSVNKKYLRLFDGRPNIFIIFIIKCLEMLSERGILAFVLPSNFLNCVYYNKLREYINNNYKIVEIVSCEGSFIETKQETVIVVIQNDRDKIESNKKYSLKIDNLTIFNDKGKIEKLKNLYENSTTLTKLNFSVSVGTVVWNQCKDILTDNNNETRLIYSSDIENQQLVLKTYKNELKKNYIKKEGLKEPLLVLNRGYGKGKYKLDFCLINIDEEYLIENHLICIKSSEPVLSSYEKIIKSFNDDRTKEFIELYFCNSAINCQELANVLPIYCDL